MRIFAGILALFWVSAVPVIGQLPKSGLGNSPPAPIQKLLAAIRQADKGQLAVSEEDGRFLRTLVASANARRVLEIGAASGYSGIWMGLGLRETGGRLTTIEFDPVRAREAAANVRAAGLDDIVQVIHGDAFVEIPKLAGPFDLVFLDAWKPDYKKFFDQVFPRVAPGGLFLAHNVINKRSEMGDFLRAIETHPQAITSIVSPGHEGISMTYRKR
jgi:predicted O-methyltransferase YrrM